MALVQAERLARSLGAPRVGVDPQEMILEMISWSAGHTEFYRQQVQALDPDALIKGVRGITKTEKVASGFEEGTSTSTKTEVGPLAHAWLERYDQERDRLANLCVQAVRLGIEQKRVEQEKLVGRRLAEALRYAHDQVLRIVRPLLPSGSPVPEEIREVFIDAIRLMTLGTALPALSAQRGVPE